MLVDLPSSAREMQSMLRVIRLCYEYAYLRGRQDSGLRLGPGDELRLEGLRDLLEGDGGGLIPQRPEAATTRHPTGHRRAHRRLPVVLPVILRTSTGLRQGVLLNISGSGMFVATSEPLPTGTSVQLRLGRTSGVEYSFPCAVQWSSTTGGLGLRITGIPLEVRHGSNKTPPPLPIPRGSAA